MLTLFSLLVVCVGRITENIFEESSHKSFEVYTTNCLHFLDAKVVFCFINTLNIAVWQIYFNYKVDPVVQYVCHGQKYSLVGVLLVYVDHIVAVIDMFSQ